MNNSCRDNKKTCPRCKGTGKIITRNYDLTTVGDSEREEPCILCDGAGEVECEEE